LNDISRQGELQCNPTSELTERGDYLQPSIQSIKLRITFPELVSSELDGGVPVRQR